MNAYNNLFWVRKRKRLHETFPLHSQNLCLIEKKTLIIILGGLYFYVYLPVIRTTDNSE